MSWKENGAYVDDCILLDRYRSLLGGFCVKEVQRMRGLTYVDTMEEPVFVEEPFGVHVILHDVFSDNDSDALYDVSYKFFITYYGKIQLQEFSAEPCADSYEFESEDLPFPC